MDIVKRFAENPLLSVADAAPELPGSEIVGVLNPAAFRFEDKTYLLVRVAERLIQQPGLVSTLIQSADGTPERFEVAVDDPGYLPDDSRAFFYRGNRYLSSCSSFRLAESCDEVHFKLAKRSFMRGSGDLETFGIEDARVTQIGEEYLLTYTQVSEHGFGTGLKSTRDWVHFDDFGMILPPMNKDCAIFSEKIHGAYAMLHRPIGDYLGGPYIWYATSPDLRHWGNHRCVAHPRPGKWDSRRIGAAAAPIRTEKGFLMLYHGADEHNRYCTGAMLLDPDAPYKVIARSDEPIMEPTAEYEKKGFFGNVIFCNGYLADGDKLTIYYGAADECTAGGVVSIREILSSLR